MVHERRYGQFHKHQHDREPVLLSEGVEREDCGPSLRHEPERPGKPELAGISTVFRLHDLLQRGKVHN